MSQFTDLANVWDGEKMGRNLPFFKNLISEEKGTSHLHFFEFSVRFFYSVSKHDKKLPDKVWGQLDVI